MKLKDSKTYLNLARSYAGECQARTRYEFIEYGARMQGYKQLAELVDKVVFNEFNHARMFYTFIQQSEEKQVENIDVAAGYPFKEKWDLIENLRIAAEDELDEAERIYPEFAATAREEGFPEIAALYDNIPSGDLSPKTLLRALPPDEERHHVQEERKSQMEVRGLRLRSDGERGMARMPPLQSQTGLRHAHPPLTASFSDLLCQSLFRNAVTYDLVRSLLRKGLFRASHLNDAVRFVNVR